MFNNYTQVYGWVLGSGLLFEKDSLRAFGRCWAGGIKNHREEFAKNTALLAPPGTSPKVMLGGPPGDRLLARGCLGEALLQRPPSQTTWPQALPGDRRNRSCENHQAHSQLLTAKRTG